MDLLLWRHAEAEAGPEDLLRPLTGKGRQQAAKVADWLRPHLPASTRILVSPANRAQQTADCLKLSFKVDRRLAPTAGLADLLALSRWPSGKTPRLLVGHQPALGQLAALLLSGQEANWTIRKGAVWWISHHMRSGKAQTYLKAVITPELL